MRPAYGRACLTIAFLSTGPFSLGWAAMTPVQATAEAGSYRLELDIGDPEQMYSKADVARLKPTSGEIMVSGQMSGGAGGMQGMSGTPPSSGNMQGMPSKSSSGGGMQGMPGMSSSSGDGLQADPATRHLELHVRSKATGKAVRNAKVSIIVVDSAGQQITVPIAVMYGITEGQEDWHYGNNVRLPAGQYGVQVSANQKTAHFDVTIADK
jgi:hypothetical protein